jgi:hypothetical protein
MKTTIRAEVVADSLSIQDERLTTVLITAPRIILAEINTHRMLSKNTSSSRAIPFKKMVEAVQNDPFIPIAWQKSHSGMQGSEYHTYVKDIETDWLVARDMVVNQATALYNQGVTKQLCNRLLEPFMWTTMLITGSREGWDNFFNLRCPEYVFVYNDDTPSKTFKSRKDCSEWYKDEFSTENNPHDTNSEWLSINKGQAEIHIMDLAEKIWDAVNESTPKQLQPGEWHIPFANKIEVPKFIDMAYNNITRHKREYAPDYHEMNAEVSKIAVKVSTAMAARTSYTVVGDEKEIDLEKMISLHDRLLKQDPPHSSPLEHSARAMSEQEYFHFRKGWVEQLDGELTNKNLGWCNNLKGFIPYRFIIDNNY